MFLGRSDLNPGRIFSAVELDRDIPKIHPYTENQVFIPLRSKDREITDGRTDRQTDGRTDGGENIILPAKRVIIS